MHFKCLPIYAALVLGTIANATEVGESGKLSSLMGGLEGEVIVTSESTITIKNYQLQKTGGPSLYWYGSIENDIPHGFRISEEKIDSIQTTPTDLTVKLDAGKSISDFNYVGLWCEPYNINFGQTELLPATASNTTGMSASSTATVTFSATADASSATSPAAATATTHNSGSSIGLSGIYLAAAGLVVSAFLM